MLDPATEHRSAAFFRSREQRRDLLMRLESEHEDELAAKLAKCGIEFFLACSACGCTHRCEQACNLKWCPACARRKSAQRCAKYERAAARMQWPLAVTLTIANTDTIDAGHVRAMRKNLGRLRRTKLWTTCVVGGLQSIELVNTGKGWHLHAHLLVDAEWIALKTARPHRKDSRAVKRDKCKAASQELHDVWCKIIGQLLASIKVRRCAVQTQLREQLKYCVKPADLIDSPDPIGPALRAISGGRLTTPFGSMWGCRRDLAEPPKAPFACPACHETGTMAPEAVVDAMWSTSDKDREARTRGQRRQLAHDNRERDRARKAERPAKIAADERARYRAALSDRK